MYPWHDTLSSWADSTNLHVDALGLVTILGADEVDARIGRLVPSRYVEFLPLLGAFVLAGNRFTEKKPGFNLYNLSSGITTGELAGWLSRWLKAQDFHQIHHKIYWDVKPAPRSRDAGFWFALLAIGLPFNGMLVALTILAGDWWGFANAMAMVMSVIVRSILVSQNRGGIDSIIADLSQEELKPRRKVIVVMEDSKVVTMSAPDGLIKNVLAPNPTVPKPRLYRFVRWVGWAAFAVHIVSIGMASLTVQICTVVLLMVSTVMTVFKVGCEDWNLKKHIADKMEKQRKSQQAVGESELGVKCWVSSKLVAVCSEYPIEWEQNGIGEQGKGKSGTKERIEERQKDPGGGRKRRIWPWESPNVDEENQNTQKDPRTVHRRDLYIWLDLSPLEEESMKHWNLMPREHGKPDSTENKWWEEYRDNRKKWEKRHRPERQNEEAPLERGSICGCVCRCQSLRYCQTSLPEGRNEMTEEQEQQEQGTDYKKARKM